MYDPKYVYLQVRIDKKAINLQLCFSRFCDHQVNK